MSDPLLIVGLGNPGARYKMTRHNAGWMFLDRLAHIFSIDAWRRKHGGEIADARVPDEWGGQRVARGEKMILFKPTGFMNASGAPVREVVDYYGVPLDRVLIVVDDVNLSPGTIRIRRKGSAGGHNGLKDIERHLGTSEYPRLRIGVGAPRGAKMIGHVLGRFSDEELDRLSDGLDTALECLSVWIGSSIEEAMNVFNRRESSVETDTTADTESN